MNGQDSAAAGLFTGDDSGKSTAAAENEDFSDMLRDFDYSNSKDLFELMWQSGANFDQPPAVSYRSQSPSLPPPETTVMDDQIIAAPSEEEMAAWLYPIVSGDDRQLENVDGWRAAPPEKKSTEIERPNAALTTINKDTSNDDSGDRKKQASSSGGAKTRSPHAAGAHNLTEKRRRLKITERLRTLKRLVPGCDKSHILTLLGRHIFQTDHASTLDQTIQYMKSLQQQVNTMSFIGSPPPPPPAAIYPAAVHPRYITPPIVLADGPPPRSPAMVPFAGAMLPYPPYPAAVLLPPPPMYRPAATAAPAAHRHGSGRSGRISKSSTSSSSLGKKQ
uniref:BHLH domain-containing protein n=1 Tax=Leersia perrieri TaxID=77586 RepID=A0A0D9Y153_9ORYZ